MNQVYEAAEEVQRLFEREGWEYCVIGGLAVIRWGRIRTTQDADFSLLTGFGDEDQFLDVLVRSFPARHEGELESARAIRVFRGYASNGTDIDIGLAALPFEEGMIDRATPYEFRRGCILKTCAAEDLVVMKAFAGRDLDWADVRTVAARQWRSLDWSCIDSRLQEVCDMAENYTSVPKLDQLRRDLEPIMKQPKRKRT